MRRTALAALCAAWMLGTGCSESRDGTLDAGSDASTPGPDAGTPAEDASSSAPDASAPLACGTRGAAPCPEGEVCIFPEGSCGADDSGGTCTVPPEVCSDLAMPVCGCDRVTYENPCSATAAGASIAREGACEQVSCDRRDIACRRAEPVCPEGQTASVVGTCYGDCVPIEMCACTEAEACPHPDRYTCHLFAMRCGPYL